MWTWWARLGSCSRVIGKRTAGIATTGGILNCRRNERCAQEASAFQLPRLCAVRQWLGLVRSASERASMLGAGPGCEAQEFPAQK